MRARQQLDRFEAGLVQILGDRQDHAGRHPLGPQALMPVADRGVDEVDVFHGRSLRDQFGRNRNKGWPNSTNSPLDTRMRSITPAVSVLTLANTFITSISPTVAPATTLLPTSTYGGSDGAGAE